MNAALPCIQKGRRSCTAKMTIGAGTILSRSSTSRLYVSAEVIETTARNVRRVVQSGSKRQGTQGDPADPSDPGRVTNAATSRDDLAGMLNAIIRGWINYHGAYYKSALYPTFRHIDQILARWAHRKFKSLRRHRGRSRHWLDRIARRQPRLFAHWSLLQGPS